MAAASQCALAAASLCACNAVIAAFPAVGQGDSPENEAGSVNIEPNYANDSQEMQVQRQGLIGGLWPSLQETPPLLLLNCSANPGQPPGDPLELE